MASFDPQTTTALRDRLDGRCVCVTGGAGFIGGHIAGTLVDLGATVRVIDDLSASTPAMITALAEREPRRVRFVRGSILDDAALADAVSMASIVVHCAAVCSVPRSVEHPERTWAVNTTGTLRVLRAAQDAGARRVVFSASSSAYGNLPGLPKREDAPVAPASPYAASKLAGEHLCLAFSETYGLSTVCLRYFNVFGPRQRAGTPYAGVIPSFASSVLAGEPPRIYGDGEQTRDFTYVDNVVLANILAATSDLPLTGEVFNIAAGSRTSINDLARLIAKGLGRPDIAAEHAPERPGEVRHSQADVAKARRDLGYQPTVGLDEGLRLALAWYRTHAEQGLPASEATP